MAVFHYGICDIGLKRKINQDSLFMYANREEDVNVFVVADGMGGHENGELASKAITDGIRQWIDGFHEKQFDGNFYEMLNSLQDKIREINRFIFKEYNQSGVCGSTLVLLFIYQNMYAVISAGDSRIYLNRGSQTKSVMVDDVWENQEELRKALTQKQIRNHPNCGKPINSIGTREVVSLSVKTDRLQDKDAFLLCSDGLYKYCPEKYYKKVLKSLNKDNLADSALVLYDQTYENGAKDNLSLILVKYYEN